MSHLPTYWKAPDGHVISEDDLIAAVFSGQFSGKILVLDDYCDRGGILSFRHTGLKSIRYDTWTEAIIAAIHRGESAREHLAAVFRQYPYICLPDLDLLRWKNSTMELLSRAIMDAHPRTQFILHGNQLSLQAHYLIELLEEHIICYSICRDTLYQEEKYAP